MQNSNSSNMSANETERPTLAELLATRAEERQQQEIVRAQQQQREQEEERTNALDFVATWARSHISDDLRAALKMNYAVDDSRLDDEIYGYTRAGFVTLDVAGCGVDDGDNARTDPNHDERWRISHERSGYNRYWSLTGPNGYSVQIDNDDPYVRTVDTLIIEAIAAYPAWVAAADERADAEQERIAAKVAAEERHKPPMYHNLQDVLQRGARVKVCAINPAAEDGMMTYTGAIVDTSDTWLMLESESGRQWALPLAQIINLTPVGAA